MHGILPPPPLPRVNSTLKQVLIAGACMENGGNACISGEDVETGLSVGTAEAVNGGGMDGLGSALEVKGEEEGVGEEGGEEGGSGGSGGLGSTMPLKQKRASSATYPSLDASSASLL